MSVTESAIQNISQETSVFRNILVATDFSEASRRALFEARTLAAQNGAHLAVLHVSQTDWRYEMVEDPPEIALEERDVQRKLRASAAELGPGRTIDALLIKHGPVAPAVLSAIAENGADLLVIGTRSRGGLTKLALGSVAEELLRSAPCPVMTVGPKVDIGATTSRPGFHTILFATDFGKASAKALPFALTLAKPQHARLLLLHMIPPIPASSSLSAYAPAAAAADELEGWEASCRKRALRQLKDLLRAGGGLEREPEYIVGTELLPEGILMAAANFYVDLIVMGAIRKGSAQFAAHIPWTAVHEVVRDSPCPVLTVAA
jgi:nucleotide-binding universal stress UspA family protein